MGSEKLVLMTATVTETCGLPFTDIWIVAITHTHTHTHMHMHAHTTQRHGPLVPKVCSVDPLGSVTTSQGILG